MPRAASLMVLAVAMSAAGCSPSHDQKIAADPIAPLCEFSGLTQASPEWSSCMATMRGNPDRDLLAAVIKARAEADATGAADIRAELAKRTHPIDAEYFRRMKVRRAQAAGTGTADCGAWHWDSEREACQP
jgi:hypothetical protein